VPSVERLESAVRALPGVKEVTANRAAEQLRVVFVPGVTGAHEISDAVAGTGLKLDLSGADPLERERTAEAREIRALTRRVAVAGAAAMVAMVLSLPLMHAEGGQGDLLSPAMMPLPSALRGTLPALYESTSQRSATSCC